jgi:hypothetical protein
MEALRTHTRCAPRLPTISRPRPLQVVRNLAASMEFYRSTLGFQSAITVPDQPP